MPDSPKSYDEWLALSDDERKRIHMEVWDVYDREGIGFAFAAAGRLAAQSPFKVYDIRIGTYHGGEYLLELAVHPTDFLTLPHRLEQSFEGFRVLYCAEGSFVADEFVKRKLKCPQCHAPYGDQEASGAGMQDDGSYVMNCSKCYAAHVYDRDFNLVESFE